MSGAYSLGDAILSLSADTAPLKRGLAEAEGAVTSSMNRMQSSIGKGMAKAAEPMNRVGGQLTKSVTLPIVGIGVAAAKSAADFQSSMELIHTQAGAPQKEIENLKNKVLDLAVATGQSPQELAAGLYHLESTGLRGAKAMDALKVAAKAAATGMAPLEETASALGGAMYVGIKGAGNFNKIMGTLNAIVGTGNMRMANLVTGLGTGLLSAAKAAGISLQNVGGAMALLSDDNWKASSASARLATALHFLYAPSTKAQGALADIHITQANLVNALNSPGGLITALSLLKTRLDALPGGLHGAKAHAVLGDVLPSGQGRVMIVLMNQLDRYKQKVAQIDKDSGNLNKDFAATTQTSTFKVRAAWDGVQVSLIKFGDDVLPAVTKALQGMANAVAGLGDAFQGLSPGLQKNIITGGLILAGLGPAMKLMGLFTSGIAKLAELGATTGKLVSGKSWGAPTKGVAGPLTSRAAAMEVATMEVAEMVVRSATGLGAAGYGPAPRDSKGRFVKYDPKATYGAGAGTKATTTEPAVVPRASAPEEMGGSAFKRAGGRAVAGAGIAITGAIGSQIAGSLIGGSTGSAVKGIGTDASIGAGLGSMFGPEGTAGGAILGGLVGTFKFFTDKSAEKSGEEFAKRFTAPLGKAVAKAATPQLVKDQESIQKDKNGVRAKQIQRLGSNVFHPGETLPLDNLPATKDTPQELAAYRKKGVDAAKWTIDGLQSVKLTSSPVLSSDFLHQLNLLPAKSRTAAATTMLQFADGLKKSGQLPASQFKLLVGVIESQVPGLASYMKKNAPSIGDAIGHNFNETAAAKPMVDLVKTWKTQSGDLVDVGKVNAGNVFTEMSNAFQKMHQAIASSSGNTRKVYVSELQKMQSSASSIFSNMEGDVAHKQAQLTKAIQSGSQQAAQAAVTNMTKLQGAVSSAMSAGVISSAKGSKMISDNLNVTLKAFGGKPIPLPALAYGVGQVGGALFGISGASPGQPTQKKNAGGMIELGKQGQAGTDTIPGMVGNQPFRVAPGETLIALNRHQRPVVDQALANVGVGGLGGLFTKYGKANSAPGYAAGGVITGPASGATFVRGMGSFLMGDGLTKIAAAGALGNMGRESSWNTGSIGTGGAGAIGWTPPNKIPGWNGSTSGPWNSLSVQENLLWNGSPSAGTGLRSYANALNAATSPGAAAQIFEQDIERAGIVAMADRINFANQAYAMLNGVVGAAGGFSPIKAPGVRGAGAIGAALTAGFAKEAKQANKYANAHQPMPAGGLGAGSGGGYGAGIPTPMKMHGPLPAKIQKALSVAEYEVGRHVPYGTGELGAYYGLNAPSLDCSGYVSTILNWAGIGPGGHYVTQELEDWGVAGPGKYLTVGVTDASDHHTMVEIANRYFESSGHHAGPGGTNLGPHEDTGWSMSDFNYRHWPGLAHGGLIPTNANQRMLQAKYGFGEHQPTQRQLAAQLGVSNGKALWNATTAKAKPKTKTAAAKDAKKKVEKAKPSRAAQLKAIAKKAKKSVPKFLKIKQPKMAPITGFQTAGMNNLAALDTKTGELQNFLGLLTSEFGVTGDVTPLISNLDGTQSVNWGLPGGPSPSGLTDPNTGQPTKGIYDRLREIGSSNSTNGSTSVAPDLMGVENEILGTENSELSQAQALANQLTPWLGAQDALAALDDKDVGWLAQVLDLTQPMPKVASDLAWNRLNAPVYPTKNLLGKGLGMAGQGAILFGKPLKPTLSHDILEKVKEYRNAQATIDRWRDLQKEIPATEKKRETALTNRFGDIRQGITSSGATATFTAGQLIDKGVNGLESERDKELANIAGAPPKGWKGDRAGWDKEHDNERAQINTEFDQRIAALRASSDVKTLSASLKKSAALATTSKQESAERNALELSFSNLSSDYTDLIGDETKLASSDKSWLTTLKTNIKSQGTSLHDMINTATTDSSGAKAVLQAYLDPMGQLQLGIAQTKSVDIPTLLAEASALGGTIVPPDTTDNSPSATDTAALDIQTQLAQQAVLALDVGASQAAVLAQTIQGLPPYIGSYEGGLSMVPGATGTPWHAIVHGGEQIVPADGGPGGGVHTVVIEKGPGVKDLIRAEIRQNDKNTARRVGLGLPSRGGGIRR